MREATRGTSKGQTSSTRLLSTEELFEGFNELYESGESEGETTGFGAAPGVTQTTGDGEPGAHAAHFEITESGDAFSLRGELTSFDSLEPSAPAAAINVAGQEPPARTPRKARKRANPVLRAIDLLADADRENITATLRGGMLEVKLPKGRMESLAAARSAVLASEIGTRTRGA